MKKLIFLYLSYFTLINFTAYRNVFSQNTPTLLPGFPVILDSLDYTYNNGPIVADFNNDGANDILVGVNDALAVGKVVLLDSQGNSFNNFPKYVSCFASYIWIAAGDVDGNGTIDIVVKSDSLYVFDFNGNSLPGFPIYTHVSSNSLGDKISLYDLDNDKDLEIILARKNVITIINHDGSVRNGWPKTIIQGGGNTNISYFAIGDLNDDNIAEIVLPSSNSRFPPPFVDSNKIFIFEPDGSEYNISPIISDSGYYFDTWNYPIIYKNNGQTFFSVLSNFSPNLMPNSYKTRFSTYNNIGQIVNQNNFTSYLNTESLTMGKLNNSVPFFLCGELFFTYSFTFDGSILPGYPLFIGSDNYRNHNIGKLTENLCFISTYTQDTVGGNGLRGYVKAWEISGVELPWSPLRPLGIPGTAPSFADLNNDGQAELIATTNGFFNGGKGCALYVWTLPGVSFTAENFPWPMWGHDRYRTNQFGFIPPDEPVGIQPYSTEVPNRFSLSQNYPNPFNPVTTIKFDIRTSYDVKLTIFDALGRQLESLVNERLATGTYSLTFDGSSFSSGVYFYKLDAGEFSETKRMILLK